VAYDEYAHVPAGLAYLNEPAGLKIYNLSPPLARYIAAIPLLFTNALTPDATEIALLDPTIRHWVYADEFARQNAADYPKLIRISRLATLPISAVGIVLVYLLASTLWGRWTGPVISPPPAILAAIVVAFDPTYLAHASLVGTDLPFAVAVLACVWALVKYHRTPTWRGACVVGVLVGTAMMVKFSALAIVPGVLVVLIATWVRKGGWAQAIAIVFTMWLVCAACYRFDAGPSGITDMQWQSTTMKSLASNVPGWAKVPVSAIMLEGFDAQKFEAEAKYSSVLFGRVYQGASVLYYPMIVLTKWPIGLLALSLVLAVSFAQRSSSPRPNYSWIVLVVGGSFLAVMLLGTSINIGGRYVMPVVPLLAICGVGVMRLGKSWRLTVWLCAAAVVVETIRALPNPLGFYNAPARLLNTPDTVVQDEDWGQSLDALRTWMSRNNVQRVRLGYFGRVDPTIYGVTYDPIDDDSSDTEYVVLSRQTLTGVPLRLRTARDGPRVMQLQAAARLLTIEPDAKVGCFWIWKSERVRPWL